jgi:lipid-A-disaccharide synthase-like uncharacterized protein
MTAWDVVGWTGQALFFSRFFVQWLASERAKRSVAPASFWWLSLAGTLLFALYSWGTDQGLFLTVFAVNLAIYARNIALGSRVARALSPPVATAIVLAACAVLWFAGELRPSRYELDGALGPWFWVGSIGALLWGGRFLLQWWYAERLGLSHFPLSFWWVSLLGNAAMLAYTLHLGELVLIVGFATGPFVQVRNLVLEYRRRAREGDAPHDDVPMPEHEIVPAAREVHVRADQAPPSRRK